MLNPMGEDIAALLGRAAATPPRSSRRPAAPGRTTPRSTKPSAQPPPPPSAASAPRNRPGDLSGGHRPAARCRTGRRRRARRVRGQT